MPIIRTLRFIVNHPLNSHGKAKSVWRFISWNVGSRLVPGPVAVNFVNDARLLIRAGMKGATGNIHTGLQEFEDMSFVLHFLREGDLFVDVGANVGSFTILAGAVARSTCMTFEPIPETFRWLQENVHLNRIDDQVQCQNCGIGRDNGTLSFTAALDEQNHAIASGETVETALEVPVQRLDDAIGEAQPCLIKIDVEGFEAEVLAGAGRVLAQKSLAAVIMEINGSEKRYGVDKADLNRTMHEYGFSTHKYEPYARLLKPVAFEHIAPGNVLYIKNAGFVSERLRSAPKFKVLGQLI